LIKAKGIRARVKNKIPLGMYEYLIARTAYFDNLFVNALNKNIPQIVLLGAGYDTRAYRFAKLNNSTKIIELDAPTTQNRKKKCLGKSKIEISSKVVFASINFNRESLKIVLEKAGYDSNKETLFLWEGVSYYIEPESVNATLELVRNYSHNESIIAFDYVISVPIEKHHNYYGVIELVQYMANRHPNERGKFAIEEEKIESFLEQQGLKMVEHLKNREIENRFLTTENGSLIGQITECFRFVLASPISKQE
jgi:methyltransferase (TIGR00027 family)